MHGILCYAPKVTGIILGISLIANATPLEGPLQYGALGLCALMCYGVYKIHKDNTIEREKMAENHAAERAKMVEEIQIKDAQFIEVIKKTDKTLNRFADAIQARPCLQNLCKDKEKPKDAGGT